MDFRSGMEVCDPCLVTDNAPAALAKRTALIMLLFLSKGGLVEDPKKVSPAAVESTALT